MNYISAAPSATTWIFIALLAVMVIVLVVLPMFTNKKRNKAVNDLHSSLRPGDVIKTVGGIIGKIVAIREISPVDKEMVIETGEGDNKSTLVFDVQAVYQVISKISDPAATVFEEISAPAATTDVTEEPIVSSEPIVEEAAPVAEVVEAAPVAEAVEADAKVKPAAKTTSKTKKTN